MKRFFRLALVAVTLLATSQVFANLAATHIIRNEVSVDFSDAANVFVATVTASTDITVNLVAAAPDAVLDAGASSALSAVSTNGTATLIFNVTSNANGLDTYEMESEAFTGGASSNGESVTSGPNTVALGGSTATATLTTFDTTDQTNGTAAGTAIVVPADNDGSDANINGFAQGDLIVLGTDSGTFDIVCTVNDLTQPTAGNEANATATIWVDQCSVGTAHTLAAGDQLGERGTITVDITVGTVAGTLNFDADIDYVGGGTGTSITQVVITVVATDLNVYKFVRNTDGTLNPACAGTALNCLVVDGATYHRSGVTANPGDTLQYAILLFNAGTSAVKVIQVTDDIAAFTTFDTGTIDLVPRGTADDTGDCETVATSGTCTVTNTENSATSLATDGTAGDDYGALVTNTVIVSGGHDGSGDAVATEIIGGELGVAEVSVVKFSVTLD
jgi:hypothetical protein